MRNKTQERVEGLARERAPLTAIDLGLVEEGIEIGKKIMAEVIADYPTAGKGAAAAPTGHGPSQAHKVAEAQSKNIAEAQSKAQVVPAVGSGYLNEVSSLTVPSKPGDPSTLDSSRSGSSRRGVEDDNREHLAEVRGPTPCERRRMSSYRFCRTDDVSLLVDALNRCWSPYFPDEPAVTPASFKRSIRDLQVWCSSCMVAFSGSDPIGVLIGAKRPSGTLIHKIAVHPDHCRQGHGRHLLTSLSSKLAILGPPRMVAEVPETLAPAASCSSQADTSRKRS